MRQAYRILPVYTGDVSGVSSALYELGGMVVMHDPSGCNSTYNTHDEIRWYDRDSLIFLSGLNAPDAILGNDEKFIGDVVKAAAEYSPAFIALCNSPVPYLTGTDFKALTKLIGQRSGIPCFYIPTNGMHDYINGAGLAWEKLAEMLFGEAGEKPEEVFRREHSLNVLGMTPLDFAAESCTASLREILDRAGWEILSVWAMGDTLADLRRAPEASVNLVVSATGFRTAEFLRKRFGTPWVAGVPIAGMRETVLSALERACTEDICCKAYLSDGRTAGKDPEVIVIGEPVISCSIAASAEKSGFRTLVLAATEGSDALIRPSDRICRGEEEIESALQELSGSCRRIIADPMYGYVCPEGPVLEEFPTLAFSGRMYRDRFMDPFKHSFAQELTH